MPTRSFDHLSRRERQIMNIVYRLGEARVSDVLADIPDPPSYSAVRALLGLLEDKGYLRHKKAGRAFVYRPVITREKRRYSALRQLVQTFFDGSVESVVAALLGPRARLTRRELESIERLIEKKRKEGE
jgi:BlaI family transcriptional regulator, penicillinase repressor